MDHPLIHRRPMLRLGLRAAEVGHCDCPAPPAPVPRRTAGRARSASPRTADDHFLVFGQVTTGIVGAPECGITIAGDCLDGTSPAVGDLLVVAGHAHDDAARVIGREDFAQNTPKPAGPADRTGVPAAMASTPTRPNPSRREGMSTRLARRRSAVSLCASVWYGRTTTASEGRPERSLIFSRTRPE